MFRIIVSHTHTVLLLYGFSFGFPASARSIAAAAKAAAEGAENTKRFASKFGRAKSYGQQTIGTPDAGAVSMSCFFQGLAQG